MKENKLFNHPVSWIIFVMLAIGSIFYIYYNFGKANSLVNIDVNMDRKEALEKAAKIAREFEIGPQEFRQAAAFRNDSHFQNFVELEAGGLDTFTQLVADGYYSSYHWSVRHFKEADANEVVFWFKPNGETYGFNEKVPESEKGAALNQEEALKIAEHNAIYNWDVDLEPYKLIEKSKEEQISGRVDHSFVYERTDKSVGDGKFRLKLVVSGDRLTSVDYHVKIPEDFDRRYSEMRSANDTIEMISMGIIAIFYGLLGVVMGIFFLMRTRSLIWKPAVFWGMGITFASVFLLTLNGLPFSWFSYDTSSTISNFLLRQILNGLMGAVGFGAIIALSVMAAEGLGRTAFPNHIRWWKIWSKDTAGSYSILGQTVAGYLFAIIILALDVLFYVTTTSHFGWWSPAGTLSDPNILANYLPWLDSIAISLQAGFWEESLFRAVPIAGIFILTRNKKSQTLWIILILILQTLVFGSAHANYAQQPSYARIIEMIVPFTIMGIIYIYYGILPAVIAHFSVDVFWISLPLWVTSTPFIWLDRFLVVLFLFAPLIIVFYFRTKNKKWTIVSKENRNISWVAPEKKVFEEEIQPETEIMKPRIEKWLPFMGFSGLVLWIIFSPFKSDAPIPEISKSNVVKTATYELKERYNLNPEDWKILTSVSSDADIRDIFVWQEGGKEIYNHLLNNFLAPPYWQVRLVKTTGKAEEKTEEFVINLVSQKKILNVVHKIPENREGENLSREEAQIIADKTLTTEFSHERNSLKEISVTPKKQENRTDWEFIYADTTNFPLSTGQGRYLIEISGNEVTNAYSYVYIPEEWIRNYKEKNSRTSIFKTISTILLTGTILLGLVLAIVRWTRKKFNTRIFLSLAGILVLFYFLENWLGWPNVISGYNTQIPIGNYITSTLISLVISGVFFTLFYSIFIAATPGWLTATELPQKWNFFQPLSLGVIVAGVLALTKAISTKTEPTWLNIDYLNGVEPKFLLAVSKTPDIFVYPIFAAVLFFGIHYYTRRWTTSKWIGILYISLAGLALSGTSFENTSGWLIKAVVIGVALFLIYFFFIRFHFEWIPLTFGLLPVLHAIEQAVTIKNFTTISGTILMVVFSMILLFWWYRLLYKYSFQKR